MLSDYISAVLGAGWISLQLAALSLVFAVVLGLLGALCKLSQSRGLRLLVGTYTTFVRGVPDLVLMLLVFYSLPALLNQGGESMGWEYRVEFSPFAAGCSTLGLIFGAYMTETFRSALQGIPVGQIEAAHAYGLGRLRTFRSIVLPQMIRLALPGFTNNWLVLIKATALVSLLGLQDMTYHAKQASAATRQSFAFLMFAAVLFLLYTTLSLWVLRRMQVRFSRGVVRGNA